MSMFVCVAIFLSVQIFTSSFHHMFVRVRLPMAVAGSSSVAAIRQVSTLCTSGFTCMDDVMFAYGQR